MKVMRTTVATVVAATLSMSAFSVFAEASLTGAGATFPAPVYAKWADTYQKETGNKVNYQGIGSSGGVKQIIANTVDFGASDAPLSDEKLAQEGLFQFPTVIGGVVLAVNIPGLKSGELVLDGKTLGDIYLGKITKWLHWISLRPKWTCLTRGSHRLLIRRLKSIWRLKISISALRQISMTRIKMPITLLLPRLQIMTRKQIILIPQAWKRSFVM
eukprot:287041_1